MGRRNKARKAAVLDRPVKLEHHHPVHYHAVVDTQWREAGEMVFSTEHGPIRSTARAFEVTQEPVAESAQPMPAAVAGQYPQLVELAQLATDAAVARLEMLAMRHPDVTVLNNLLAAAYSRRGRMTDALLLVERNYRQAPGYLFARIQYAQMCLATGRAHDVPGIFDHHFDLKMLYPNRGRYHISEFAAFIAVVAEYHCVTGDVATARQYHETLCLIAPDHELTGRLETLLRKAG